MTQPQHEVVITGVGPVTSAGTGREDLWSSLLAGKANTQPRTVQSDVGRVSELTIASMPPDDSVPGLATHAEFLKGQDAEGYRDLAYALLAVELALTDAELEYDRNQNSIGAIQAFEAPGVECAVNRLFRMFTVPLPTDGPPPVYELLAPYFYNMQPFVYVHLLGKAFGFHGYSTGVHNACASGVFAIEAAAHRIRTGEADVMVVVGGEAFDTGVRLEWFHRLDLYARDTRFAPFDSESTGFYVGEGAGAIVLESAEHAKKRGATPYAKYLGGSFAQQGWKQVIPDVRAARLRNAIVEALQQAQILPQDLHLIVPHGAGTQLSDGYEAASLAAALHGQRDQAIATAFKPHVGHTLAASGIIETICTLLAMRNQIVPATLNTHPERVQLPVPLATTTTPRTIKNVLKLATGFTGHDAALVFSTV